MMKSFIASKDDADRRLDRVIRKFLPDIPLSAVYSSLRKKRILLNGRKASASSRVQEGDRIEISTALLDGLSLPVADPRVGVTDLDIIFESDHILAVNKPPGVSTHGKGSLAERVTAYLGAGTGDSLSFRPGPLHRLDKDTTGVLIFGKTLAGSRLFSSSLRDRKTGKFYLALLDGRIYEKTRWTTPVQGSKALSAVYPLRRTESYTLACIRIYTGRKHQIRIQAAEAGHPVSGDRTYGGSPLPGGYILHSYALAMDEFDTTLGFHTCCADLPEDSSRILEKELGQEELDGALKAARKIISDQYPLPPQGR